MSSEKMKTMIGGQALIEGILMRGPDKDAVVVRTADGIETEVTPRAQQRKNSPLKWPLIRGVVNFFDAQIVGVKAIMRSADLSPDDEEKPSKFDIWLEKKLGAEKFRSVTIGFASVLAFAMVVGLFFLLPMVVGSLFDGIIESNLIRNLIEGIVRIAIFFGYMILVSRMGEMKRVFAYHGAEHKTIRCYEAKLPLTVENARQQSRLHPRCGTSFLLVVLILSILLFSVASSALLAAIPGLEAMRGTFLFKLIMIGFKLLLIPVVVSLGYEINRLVGRYDNVVTRILTKPGMWFQNFTTNEPDDGMLEVAITALTAVLPEQEGADQW